MAVLASIFAAPSVRAAPSSPTAGPAPAKTPADNSVVLVAVVNDGLSDGLQTAIGELQTQLARQGITFRLERTNLPSDAPALPRIRQVAEAHAARGVFWFDQSAPGAVGVYLLSQSGETFGRRVQTDDDSPEASVEAVWLIVSASALALATGEAVQMRSVALAEPEPAPEPDPLPQPERAPSPEPAPKPKPERNARLGLVGAAGYLGSGFAPELVWQHGASVSAAVDARPWLRLGAGYGLLAPPRSSAAPIGARHQLALRVGLVANPSPRFQLEGRVSPGAEFVQWDSGTDGGIRTLATLGVEAVLHIALTGPVFLQAGLGATTVLNRFAFVECAAEATTCSGDDRRVLLTPWRVRPRVHVGVGLHF